jgi:protoporphyrinogen oxidase
MNAARPQSEQARATASHSKSTRALALGDRDVAVVGGGIAGLTSALRLAQRGFKVTLYEKAKMLGGNLSSDHQNGMYRDVYPHLFCDWYANFWQIVQEDLKIKQDEVFEPRMGIKVLELPDTPPATKPAYQELKNPSTLHAMWHNLWAGVSPPPDMFLVGFTLLDLASQPFHRRAELDRQTVNGFLNSRGYGTEYCANLHDLILMEIWSIHGSDTSAGAYKNFVKHGFGFPYARPFALLLRGSLEQKLIKPWCDELTRRHCTIECSVGITQVELSDADKPVRLTLSDGIIRQHKNVVLAVPPTELAQLVMKGSAGTRIVDRVPQLSGLRQLHTARILVLNLYFNEKLRDIPSEHVGLVKSDPMLDAEPDPYLTFLDISQLWTCLSDVKKNHTVLVLAASDAYALPSDKDEECAYMMIRELAKYLTAVKPGDRWGATTNTNINYSKSWYQTDRSRTLFLNDVDSDRFQPTSSYKDLPNVFFAGDFCKNDVKMATVEAAVVSGLNAVRALQERVDGKSDITIAPQMAHSPMELLAMRLALLPLAYGAKAWSTVNSGLGSLADGHIADGMLTPALGLSLIPFRYAAHWWETIEALGIGALTPKKKQDFTTSAIPHMVSLAARGLLAGSNYLQQVISEQSWEREPNKPSSSLKSLAKGLLKAIDEELRRAPPASLHSVTRTGAAATEGWYADLLTQLQSAVETFGGPPPGSGPLRPRYEYRRRHRAKL